MSHDNETDDDPPLTRNTVVFLAIAVEGGLLLLAWFLGWIFQQPTLTRLQGSLKDVGLGVLATLPMVGIGILLLTWPIGPLRDIRHFIDAMVRPMMEHCTVIDLLGISVLAGLGEELLFRGIFQPAFAINGNVWIGLAASSVLFGLLHAYTSTYALLATVMGAYLGWLTVWSEGLLVPVIVHALYDFLLLLWILHGPASGSEPLNN